MNYWRINVDIAMKSRLLSERLIEGRLLFSEPPTTRGHLRIDLGGGVVEEFRYYCLRDDGRIAFGESIVVAGLDEAIRQGRAMCLDNDLGIAFKYVEVWRGSRRVYSGFAKAVNPA